MATGRQGQRGLIVARQGRQTVLLQNIAASIAANHPEAHLMGGAARRAARGGHRHARSVRGEVISSTFDRPAKEHIAIAELAVERAKRWSRRQDVVILLDSLTRLCGAQHGRDRSGRTLSAAWDAAALQGTKRLFGAARLAEEGGSLTILATALVRHRFARRRLLLRGVEGHRQHGAAPRPDARPTAGTFPAIDVTPPATAARNCCSGRRVVRDPRPAAGPARAVTRSPGLEVLLDRIRQTRKHRLPAQIQSTLPVERRARPTPWPPGRADRLLDITAEHRRRTPALFGGRTQ